MRKYIVNLTSNLINKNRYDEIFARMNNPSEFLTHIALDLESDDVKDMSPETLGKIMCSFEIGDVMSGHPGKEVKFSGDCEDLLREIVSICLAYVIRSRLNGESKTPYRRGRDPIKSSFPFIFPELTDSPTDILNRRIEEILPLTDNMDPFMKGARDRVIRLFKNCEWQTVGDLLRIEKYMMGPEWERMLRYKNFSKFSLAILAASFNHFKVDEKNLPAKAHTPAE